MKRMYVIIVLLLLFGCNELCSQTTLKAIFQRVIRDDNGIPITGLDVDLYIWGDTAKYVDLVEDVNSPGTYYKDSLEYGLYDIYIGGILKQEAVFHGANKMNLMADKFTNDLVQLMTIGIKDSAVEWEKLSEAVKDSIRKRRIGDYIWGYINWGDLGEALKDSIRKDSIGSSAVLAEDFLDSLIQTAYGIKVTWFGNSIALIGFDTTSVEKDTIFARIHRDSTTFGAAKGNFVFQDSGCIKIYRKLGVDSLIPTLNIINDTLSVSPLVVISDTTHGTRIVNVPDTIVYDAADCITEAETEFCEDTLTIPIYFRRVTSIQVIPSDTITVCDTVCTRYNIFSKDTSFAVFTDEQMSNIRQIQRQMYGLPCDTSRIQPSYDPTICIRKYNPGNWLANMKEGDPNYPFRGCETGTKCDTTAVCCIRKSILLMYMQLIDMSPTNTLWIDSTREIVDCLIYANDPKVKKDSVVCISVYNIPTGVYADTFFSYIGDTLIAYDKCLYKCPKAYILQGLPGYFDTTYITMPIINSTLIGYDTIPADNTLNTWYVVIDSVETFFVDAYARNEPWSSPNTFMSLHTLDSLKLLWPYIVDTLKNPFAAYGTPAYKHGYYPMRYATLNTQTNDVTYHNLSWSCNILQIYSEFMWDDQVSWPPYHPNYDIYIWFPVDSLMNLFGCDTLQCGVKNIHSRGVFGSACYTEKYRLAICYDPFSNNVLMVDTFWYHMPNNQLGIPCVDQIINLYSYDTIRIDSTMFIEFKTSGGYTSQLYISDTCACSTARLIMPNGQSMPICGDIYFRNDCIGGIDPYIENGNTVVFNYSCGGGGSTTGISGTNYISKIEMQYQIARVRAFIDSVGDSIFVILNSAVDSLRNRVIELEGNATLLQSKVDSLVLELDTCCNLNQTSPITTFASVYVDNSTGDSLVTNLSAAGSNTAIVNWRTVTAGDFTTDSSTGSITIPDSSTYMVTLTASFDVNLSGTYSLTLGTSEAAMSTVAGTIKTNTAYDINILAGSGIIKYPTGTTLYLYANSSAESPTFALQHLGLTFTKLIR